MKDRDKIFARAVFLLQALFSFAQHITLAYIGENVMADIRVSIFTHLQSLPLSFYADRRTGELVSRLTNDVALLQQALTTNLATLMSMMITVIGAA